MKNRTKLSALLLVLMVLAVGVIKADGPTTPPGWPSPFEPPQPPGPGPYAPDPSNPPGAPDPPPEAPDDNPKWVDEPVYTADNLNW